MGTINARVRFFKKPYCNLPGIKYWKKCPEYYCPIWNKEDEECPHFQIKEEPIEVGYEIDWTKKDKQEEGKNS